MEYLKVWTSFREVISALNDSEKGRLFDAMLMYTETGEEPQEFKGNERFLWPVAKQGIDQTAQKCDKLRGNGLLGGRPNTKQNQTKANETKQNQTEANESLKEKEKDKDKDKTKKRPPIPPKGFDEFWSVYPKKVDKQHALKAYEKILPDDALIARMISSVKVWKNSEQWTKDNGQFIPNPATWLNGHRWEDEQPNIVPIKSTGWNYAQRSYSEDELESRTDAI